jgi:hypothetical protein
MSEDAENARAGGVVVAWADASSQWQAAGLDEVTGVAFEDAVPVRGLSLVPASAAFSGILSWSMSCC